MTRTARLVLTGSVGFALVMAMGCGGQPSSKAGPPAKIDNPRKEADLTTITLTPESVARLGITTVAAEVRDVGLARSLGGELITPPGRSAVVTAPVTGRVDVVPGVVLSAGSILRAGVAVLRLTPLSAPPRDLRVTSAADLQATRSRFDAAQRQLDRAKQMLNDQVGSQRGVEQAQQEYGQAKAALDAASERMTQMDQRPLDADVSVPVSVPFDGVVRRLIAAPGQVVMSGATLFEADDVRLLWVRVPVYVGDLGDLAAARDAAVEVAGGSGAGSRRTAARVNGPPTADPQSSTADLFFALPNGDGAFRAGQRVAVSIQTGSGSRGLVVPSAAVTYDYHGGAWVYLNTKPHTYVRQRVEVARTVGPIAVLARGPEPGALVVASGVAELFGTEFGAGK